MDLARLSLRELTLCGRRQRRLTAMRISDRQWKSVSTRLMPPANRRRRGRPTADNRKCFEGILWILSRQTRWRELPKRYGSPSCVNRKFLDWMANGVWARMFQLFIDSLETQKERLYWLGIQERLQASQGRRKHAYKIRRLPLQVKPLNSRHTLSADPSPTKRSVV